MIYLDLLIGFLKVEFFTFGGGYGAVPLIRDIVLSYGWIDDQMLTDMIAISESTPGPIMVNLATYVGSSKGGIPGALIATSAVILPSFVITILIMSMLDTMLRNKYVQAALRGLKPCIVGIILATGCFMVYKNTFGVVLPDMADFRPFVIACILALLFWGSRSIQNLPVFKKGISPIGLILLSACIGVVMYGI